MRRNRKYVAEKIPSFFAVPKHFKWRVIDVTRGREVGYFLDEFHALKIANELNINGFVEDPA